MLLYQDGLVDLKYEVTKDILAFRWPTLQPDNLVELENACQKIIDTINHYDIKRLLVDSRSYAIEITDQKYKQIVSDLGKAMARTRLEKIARLTAAQGLGEQEQKAQAVYSEVVEEIRFQIPCKNFETEGAAMAWLKE
ncbi:MAG: hypothetical protein ACO1OQ_14750 [Rufibacter sp.]